MNFDWQNILALALVAGAVAYLARLGWKTFSARKAGGCGTCGSCSSAGGPQQAKDAAAGPIVSLDELVDSARHKN